MATRIYDGDKVLSDTDLNMEFKLKAEFQGKPGARQHLLDLVTDGKEVTAMSDEEKKAARSRLEALIVYGQTTKPKESKEGQLDLVPLRDASVQLCRDLGVSSERGRGIALANAASALISVTPTRPSAHNIPGVGVMI